jgi:hypothetical protein
MDGYISVGRHLTVQKNEWISQLISNAIVTTSQSTCGKLEFTSAMSNAYFASLLDSSISPLFAQSLLLHLLVI